MEGSEPDLNPLRPTCARTAFLEVLLDDKERGRLRSLEHYLLQFADLRDFVRAEYTALASADSDEPSPYPDLPSRLGRYELRRILGEGGMGRVFEAYDPGLCRRVVVKCLRPDLGIADQARERLRREARLLGQLAHPNLARVIDLIESEGRLHLVLAFHEGKTLGDHIAAARQESGVGRPPWLRLRANPSGSAEDLRSLIVYFVTAARALSSAHAAGIVHRDLKPQNLMVTPEGEPVVLDFGLALSGTEERLTVAGELLGTPLYMAPEQIEGGTVDERSDVYSLGVTLYEALTLVQPFGGGNGRAAAFHRILRGDPVALRRHRPMMPRDLEAVVLRAMERDPARRYPGVLAFADDLQRVLDLEPTEARPASGFGLMVRRLRRRPAALALIGTVVVLVVLTVCAWGDQAHNRNVAKSAKQMSDSLALTLKQLAARGDGDTAVLRSVVLQAESLGLKIGEFRSGGGSDRGISILHPVGKVLSPVAVVWTGLQGLEGNPGEEPYLRIDYRYCVRIRGSDGAITKEWGGASCHNGVGAVMIPEGLLLPSTDCYTIEVELQAVRSVELIDPEHASAEQRGNLELCRAVKVEDLADQDGSRPQRCQFWIEPDTTILEGSDLRALQRNQLWSDLRLLLRANPFEQGGALGSEELWSLAGEAAKHLGDLQGEAEARRKVELQRSQGRR